MSWMPWLIGLAIVIVGVPALGALGVAALAVVARLLVGTLGAREKPEKTAI